MQNAHFARGAIRALLAAGPVFVIVMFVLTVLYEGVQTGAGPSIHAFMIPMLLISIPVGAITGGIPIAAGGYGMSRLGSIHPATRHPLIWMTVCAVISGALWLIFGGTDWIVGQIFAITGAICALIVRYGTRWSDEASV